MDDLPDKVAIGASPAKLLQAVVMWAALMAFCLLAAKLVPHKAIISLSVMAMSGVGTLHALWRLFRKDNIAVTLDAGGIRDTRLYDRPIPWSTVRDISFDPKHKDIVLRVDPDFVRKINPSGFAATIVGPNRPLYIRAGELKTDCDAFYALMRAYWTKNSA